MSTNTQSRSVSVSHASQGAHNPPRHSASISGSSFIGNSKSSSFFSNEDSFTQSAEHTTDLETSLEDEIQQPLDIVGALNTLNLDAELNESLPISSQSTEHEIDTGLGLKTPAFSSEGAAADRTQASSVPPQRILSHDILTPNPASSATFGAIPNTLTNPALTPSYGWGANFLPFSAPPVAYPMSDPSITAEMALHIPPFRLPDEHISGGLPIALGTPSRGSSMTPQPLHNFGGILDSRFAFDGFGASSPDHFGGSQYGKYDKNYPGSGTSGKAYTQDGNTRFEKRGDGVMRPKAQQYPGPGLWNESQMPPFVSQPHESYMNNQYSQYSQLDMMPSHPNHASGSLGGPGYADNSGSFGGSRAAQSDHYNGGRRHNHHMNNGVNIHRKMHNSNRRKGDDASKYANAKLEDFTGDIFSLCKDQHGCRFLQRQLDLGSEAGANVNALTRDVAATMIFNELYLKIVELMVDPFGNYLIQKLFESVSADQRLILVKNAAPEFIRVALDPHGTRALQKLVECISTPEEAELIIESLSPHIVVLSRDLNGNHVVQKCLQRLKPEDNQFIFDTASAHCAQIATHRHGCCVLQRCLDHGNAEQREQLSSRVAEVATNLSLDPFGNYVVQYVLTRGDDRSIAMILDHILSNIVSLSLHKFGSNVIEKSLRISRLTDAVIDVLLRNSKQFSVLLNDPFGNYVLQTSLDVASASDLAKLASSLQPYLASIKNTPHGRRILTKIQNIL